MQLIICFGWAFVHLNNLCHLLYNQFCWIIPVIIILRVFECTNYVQLTQNAARSKITHAQGSRIFDEYWLYIVLLTTRVQEKGFNSSLKLFPYNHNTLISFNLMSIIPIIYGCILLALLTPWSHIRKMNMFHIDCKPLSRSF